MLSVDHFSDKISPPNYFRVCVPAGEDQLYVPWLFIYQLYHFLDIHKFPCYSNVDFIENDYVVVLTDYRLMSGFQSLLCFLLFLLLYRVRIDFSKAKSIKAYIRQRRENFLLSVGELTLHEEYNMGAKSMSCSAEGNSQSCRCFTFSITGEDLNEPFR